MKSGQNSRDQFAPLVRAGTVGAIAVSGLTTPFDVVRHAAQAAFARRRAPLGPKETLSAATSAGVAGLWRGLAPAVGHAAFGPAVFLCVYELQRGEKSAFEAAAYARAAQTVLLQPFDFARTCAQACAASGTAPHLERSVLQVVSKDGGRSLWRGLIPTVLRDVSASTFFYLSYTWLREPLCTGPEGAGPPAAIQAAALGAVCNTGGALATQPLDVIKTRMQIHERVRSDKAGWRKVTVARVSATAREIHKVAGPRGFLVGAMARALKAGVSGLALGPLCEYCGLVADDAGRPSRRRLDLGEDPSRTIVHPRSYKSTFIDVK